MGAAVEHERARRMLDHVEEIRVVDLFCRLRIERVEGGHRHEISPAMEGIQLHRAHDTLTVVSVLGAGWTAQHKERSRRPSTTPSPDYVRTVAPSLRWQPAAT